MAGSIFDFETEPTITLTITATDDGDGTLSDTQDVTITVSDVTFAPVFESTAFNFMEAVRPAFGDVDGDGDMDLLVGVDDGSLVFFAEAQIVTVSQLTIVHARVF